MAIFVAPFVISDFALAVGSTWDHRNRACFAKAFAQSIGIIALVGDQISYASGPFDQIICNGDVGHITWRQEQGEGTPKNIRQGMDLGCLSAA